MNQDTCTSAQTSPQRLCGNDPDKESGNVFGIAGRSGSGKTTLIEAMLPLFAQAGLRVNVIKHSHHDLELEPPGKDSARFRHAGAQEVLVTSPYRFAIVRELRQQPEPSLREQLARLAPADLTLVEGFKQESIPRLEVWRPATGHSPLHQHPGFDCIAVASDAPAPESGLSQEGLALQWLPLDKPAEVAQFIARHLRLPWPHASR